MADVNANIGISIDSSNALAQLKALQRQIALFHTSVARSSETAALAQQAMQKNLVNSINSLGGFTAELRTVRTTAESFTNALEKNKFSMREYFRYAAASTRTFGRTFTSEFDTVSKTAEDRVRRLQTQYIKMGRDASGAMKAIAVIPDALNMEDRNTQMQIAAQRQQIFNQLVRQGSTNLLNFGKNTQWAGRQLMVGFTLPLATLGTVASKTFMEMEQAALKFRKVYGDLFTSKEETDAALENIQNVAQAYTKYGISVAQTVALASDAAAAGFQGLDLQRQTEQATRLAILGQIDQQQALDTTISLQNAFRMSSEDLADAINFLNAVENQTVTGIEDLTIAIPKAAPVVQQLGGDVKDLAFFLTAMKEGGINASEGANALKSGLASLINPTGKAADMLAEMGININEIVESNRGDLKATVIEFAEAMNRLDPLARARAIEQLFGKFQFARISTLLQNVTATGTQADRVLGLASASVQELADLSAKELGMTAESAMNKFKGAVEDLRFALVPIGEVFLNIVTPAIESVTKILDAFNNLSDGTKRTIATVAFVLGGIGPIALMTFGLLANGFANIIKGAQFLRNTFLRLSGQSKVLGLSTEYLTAEQLDAAAAAASLNQAHASLTQQFTVEATAVNALRDAYLGAISASNRFATTNPGMMVPRRAPRFAQGGMIKGPGTGTSDSIIARVSNGEAIIPAKSVARFPDVVNGLISGNMPGFRRGRGATSPRTLTIGSTVIDASAISQTQHNVALRRIQDIGNLTESELSELANIIARFVGSVGAKANELDAILRESTSPAISSRAKSYSESQWNAKAAGERRTVERQLLEDRPSTGAQEYERAQMIASAAATAMNEAGVEMGRVVDAGQIVRGHIVTFSNNAIKTASPLSFSADIWDSISQAENQLSRILADSGQTSQRIRGLYLEELNSLNLEQSVKNELERKILNDLALSEDEYQIQAQILRNMQQKASENATYARSLTGAFQDYSIGVLAAADVRAIYPMATAGRTQEEITRGQGAALLEAVRRGQGGVLSSEEISFLVQNFEQQYADAIAEAGRMASPSRELDRHGQDTVAGYVRGVRSGIDDAVVAGETLADAVTDTVAHSGRTRGGRRVSMAQGAPGTQPIIVTDIGRGTSVTSPIGQMPEEAQSTRGRGSYRPPVRTGVGPSGEMMKYFGLSPRPGMSLIPVTDVSRRQSDTVDELNKNLGETTSKMSKFTNNLTSVSFAASALSGVLMMATNGSNAALSDFMNKVFMASNALMAFSMINNLIPAGGIAGKFRGATAAGRAAAAGTAISTAGTAGGAFATARGAARATRVAGAGSGLPGVLGKIVPLFGRLAVVVTKFLGPWGIAIGLVSAGIGIWKWFNKRQEEAAQRIAALGEAARLSEDKIKQLGDFFGVTPTSGRFARGREAELSPAGEKLVTPEERTQLEALKANEEFQKTFAKDIETIRNATNRQASIALQSLATQLFSSGFTTDQVTTIVTAIQEEANKTDVVIDFKSINLGEKGSLKALRDSVNKTLKEFSRGYAMGGEQLEKTTNLVASSLTNVVEGISNQFENGIISAKQFNAAFDSVSKSISNMPEPQQIIIMSRLMENLPEELRAAASGIRDAGNQMMFLKAQAVGMSSEMIRSAIALRAVLDDPAKMAKEDGRARAAMSENWNNFVANVAYQAQVIEKALVDAGLISGTNTSTTTETTPAEKGLSNLQKAVIKRYENELKALQKKRDALREVNDELKRQFDFEQRQNNLAQQMIDAKVSGNYIQAALLNQERLFEASEFQRETKALELEKKIANIEDRIREIEQGGRVTKAEAKLAANIAKIIAKSSSGAAAGTGGTPTPTDDKQPIKAPPPFNPSAGAPSPSFIAATALGSGFIPISKITGFQRGKSFEYQGIKFTVDPKNTANWYDSASRRMWSLRQSRDQGWGLKRYAQGGLIKGPGTGTSDSIMAVVDSAKRFNAGGMIRVSNNEYVMRAKAVKDYGVGFMNSVNSGTYPANNTSTVYNSYNIDVSGVHDPEMAANLVMKKLQTISNKSASNSNAVSNNRKVWR